MTASTGEDGPGLDSTTGPGTSGATDPGTGDSGEDSTGQTVPDDRVPVFVSIAHGGQTAMTCDRGRSWHGFHEFGPQDDHSDYAAFGGITFGGGVFVAATGWGAPGHILRSTDGLAWDDRPDAAFVNEAGEVERPVHGTSGVEWTGERFLMFSGGQWESEDGLSWRRNTPETLGLDGHFREVEYLSEPDLLLIAVQSYDAPGNPWRIQVSHGGGATWSWGDGVTPECMGWIQHAGGFAHHDGRLVVGGGAGPTCTSDDGGLTWQPGGDAGVTIADLKVSDAGLLLLGEDGSLRQSTDAARWTLVADTGLGGGRIAWADATGYVGAAQGYAYADDPGTWTAAMASLPPGFGGVREFALGMIEPTDACPLP